VAVRERARAAGTIRRTVSGLGFACSHHGFPFRSDSAGRFTDDVTGRPAPWHRMADSDCPGVVGVGKARPGRMT